MPSARRVARQHGASCAAFFTQSCAVDVAYAHAWAGRVKPPLAGDAKVLPGLPAGLGPRDLPTFLVAPDECPAYLDLVVNQFNGLDTADHVLVNSFHELEPQESEFLASTWRAMTVGPTVPSAYLDNRLPGDASYGFHLYTPLTATTKTRAWSVNHHRPPDDPLPVILATPFTWCANSTRAPDRGTSLPPRSPFFINHHGALPTRRAG